MKLKHARYLGAYACLCAALSVWLTAPTQAKYTAVREAGTVFAQVTATSGISQSYTYTGAPTAALTIPASGYYTLSVYGAKGGDAAITKTDLNGTPTRTGGKGGSAQAQVFLYKGTELYAVVGGAGIKGPDEAGATLLGGYNGGGGVDKHYQDNGNLVNHRYGSGGGATHFATKSGLLKDLANDQDAVLIVAGGGGGARIQHNDGTEAARAGDGGDGGSCINGGKAGSYFGKGGGGGGFASGAQVNAIEEQIAAANGNGYAFGLGETGRGNGGGGGGYYGGYSGSALGKSYPYTGCGGGGAGYLTQGVTDEARNATFAPKQISGAVGGNTEANGRASVAWASKAKKE